MKNDPVFKQHPNLKGYHETSDGVKFFKKADAHVHARSLKDKAVKFVVNGHPVEAAEKADSKTSKKEKQGKASKKNDSKPQGNQDNLTPSQKAKLAKEAIENLETVEAVEAALKDENYPSVIKAGEERIEALKLQTEKTGEGTGKENTGTDAPVNGTETETKSEEEE